MPVEREEGVGLHEVDANGWQVTVNNSSDPKVTEKYGDDAYYVSYGEKNDHVTQIFDGDGNEVPNEDQPEHGKSGS